MFLQRLGSDWQVLHSIPVGGPGGDIDHRDMGDREIDHLVVGRRGVYTVNSSHHASESVWLGEDTIMVHGQRVHPMRDGRLEAARASRLLSAQVGFQVPVVGLVVIVGDTRFDVGQQPADGLVQVTTPRAAVRWLRRRENQWTSYGVERICEYARRPTTWVEPAQASRSRNR